MRYHVLVCDYDGTLAHDGRVTAETVAALRALRDTGRHVLLVTGRELDDLLAVFPEVDVFARVVAENGAVLYHPETREHRALHEPVPDALVDVLRGEGVTPLSRGHVIVSTWQPWETVVLRAIQTLGLEVQIVFNKGAVMVMPPGVNKASGLLAALAELKISPHSCVGIGDAENDHAFLTACECAVAVANALPMLKERADLVTEGSDGAGAQELVERLRRDDLADLEPRLARHRIPVGTTAAGEEVSLAPAGTGVLIAGPSGSGKSTLATAIMERLIERAYQLCVIDPEGDYANLPGAVVLGDQEHAPSPDEILDVLDAPDRHVVVNLLGVPLKDRPGFFAALLPRIQELRARVGRPYCLVVDEAHHLLPHGLDPARLSLPSSLTGVILITVHPEHVAPAILEGVGEVFGVGGRGEDAVRGFVAATGRAAPAGSPAPLAAGEVLHWSPAAGTPPRTVRIVPPRAERRRHVRKYAEGELGPDRSFYFRGPGDRLNLRAQNLATFVQLAEGVDDETWLHHLRRQDYSRWFREAIKNDELADDAAAVEREGDRPAGDSRARIRAAIEQRYTLPA
jgi:HAD superfamily hydrolase (TIGR01484 family)